MAGIAAGALWGFTFVAPLLAPDFGPVAITIGRFLACGIFSGVLLAGSGGQLLPLLRLHLAPALWLSVLGSVGYFLLMTIAVQQTGAALTALIIGCLPVTVPLTAAWRDHRLLMRLAPALLLIAAGLALKSVPPVLAHAGGFDLAGLAAAIGALILWNAYAILNARHIRLHPGLSAGQWASVQGVAALLLLPLLVPGLLVWEAGALPDEPAAWAGFALMALLTGIGSAWAAAWAWNIASRRLPVALAGQLIISETLFALLYAYLLEQRWPAASETAAIFLAIIGVLWGIRVLHPKAAAS